ncbi:MAG TPA: asparaginase domain-containing protein [Ktedonobacteraceae bacterium]
MTQVYVLYTGGTIGSTGSPLAPMSGPDFIKLVLSMPGLADFQVAGYDGLYYTIDYLDTPLDSSNMTPSDWIVVASRILSNYADYDGFVILHGTDTMSWTASVLSFFLEGLSKPVILTGSQLPLARSLNDALRNLLASIILAGTTNIPEVCLFFNTMLMRGNRTVKADASGLSAFMSPNFPPLANVGIRPVVNPALVLQSPPPEKSLSNPDCVAKLQSTLDRIATSMLRFSVVSVTLFPGIQCTTMLEAILQGTKPPVLGIVLGAFGAGDAPLNSTFLGAISAADKQGVIIIDGTQVIRGSVNMTAYQTGSSLLQAGSISGYDLTAEAMLTKLIYLIALGLDQNAVKVQMQTNLRGEMTVLPV